MNSVGKPLLEAHAISKRFPGVQALDSVSLSLHAGEVLAVIGGNGAGKSTLMKILAGAELADDGVMFLDGEPLTLRSVADGMASGVALIHQELALADNLNVGENVLLGREPRSFGFVQRGAARARSIEALRMVGLDIDPSASLDGMGMGQQQQLEIAKALAAKARVLIMDEPTSSLTLAETERLYKTIDALRSAGTAVLFISHRLREVERIADRVIVLRDGAFAGELKRDAITHNNMVRLMVGRDVDRVFVRSTAAHDNDAVSIESFRTVTNPEHAVNLNVRRGEIVGLAGLVGAGRTELLRAVFGLDEPLAGCIRVGGRAIRIHSPRDAIAAGIAFVPEDRKGDGLLLAESVQDNLSLPSLQRLARCGFRVRAGERELGARCISELAIEPASPTARCEGLSGGNQQKVVLGKWLARDPQVLLLDEPTRGVDVGAKEAIYRLMNDNAKRGRAVLFASSDMEELLSLADRIYVLHEGAISGELERDEFDEKYIMHLATGGLSA